MAAKKVPAMEWPDDCPRNCPPEDAVPSTEKVYRFVLNDPPTADDFYTLVVNLSKKQKSDPETHCQACGVSVTDTLENARALRLLPVFAKKMLAAGPSAPGVVKPTPRRGNPGHATWWVPNTTAAAFASVRGCVTIAAGSTDIAGASDRASA